MRILTLALIVFCSSCSTLDPVLQTAISYGEIRDLNKYTPGVDKKLLVRLFHAPIYLEDCFKETHGICQYRYFLSVSTFDEYPETNIYALDTAGEIEKIKWVPSPDIDTANLELFVNSYTKDALINNSDLVNNSVTVNIVVTPKEIEESVVDVAWVE